MGRGGVEWGEGGLVISQMFLINELECSHSNSFALCNRCGLDTNITTDIMKNPIILRK